MLMTETKHGDLVLAEYSADERTVSAALKAYDPHLRLIWELDSATGRQVWKVVSVWSSEHPAVMILAWRENGIGDPMPLTMRLVDEVRKLREVDPVKASLAIDDANAKVKARLKQKARDDAQAISDEHKPYVDRNRVQVTTAAIPLKPGYMRNKRLRGETP